MPKITRDVVLLSVSFGLLIAIVLMTVFGCRCRMEFFEDGAGTDAAAEADKDVAEVMLTKKEAELFEGLQLGKYSEAQIKDFMKSGVLNEKIIDKFLSKMTAAAEPAPVAAPKEAPAAKPKAAATGAAAKKAVAAEEPKPMEDPKIEQFSTLSTITKAQNAISKIKRSA